jgi:hypothetical protein
MNNFFWIIVIFTSGFVFFVCLLQVIWAREHLDVFRATWPYSHRARFGVIVVLFRRPLWSHLIIATRPVLSEQRNRGKTLYFVDKVFHCCLLGRCFGQRLFIVVIKHSQNDWRMNFISAPVLF